MPRRNAILRAFRHFETFRGGPIKPWLLAILRNVCRAEYARRGALAAVTGESLDAAEECAEGLWSEARSFAGGAARSAASTAKPCSG